MSTFQSNFEFVIKNDADGVTLFAILSRHLIGDAADVVKACNFIGNYTCYEEKKLRLKNSF